MRNDTKIYVSKKAALIVESIRDHSKEGNGSQKYNGHARKFTVEFIDGTTYESNNSLHVQNHIKDKYDEDGKAMLEQREAARSRTQTRKRSGNRSTSRSRHSGSGKENSRRQSKI